jgi:hypothetical protein
MADPRRVTVAITTYNKSYGGVLVRSSMYLNIAPRGSRRLPAAGDRPMRDERRRPAQFAHRVGPHHRGGSAYQSRTRERRRADKPSDPLRTSRPTSPPSALRAV